MICRKRIEEALLDSSLFLKIDLERNLFIACDRQGVPWITTKTKMRQPCADSLYAWHDMWPPYACILVNAGRKFRLLDLLIGGDP